MTNRTRTRTFAPLAAFAAVAALTLTPALSASAAGSGVISVSNNCGATISVSVLRNGIEITPVRSVPNGETETYEVATGGGYTVNTSLGGSHDVFVIEDRAIGFRAC
jgi:hypothetical protein